MVFVPNRSSLMSEKTVVDFISPSRYLAIVCSAISLFIVIFLMWELKRFKDKLLRDVHYQLRLLLVLVLLCNKIWNIVYLVACSQSDFWKYHYVNALDVQQKNPTIENTVATQKALERSGNAWTTTQIYYYVLYVTYSFTFYLVFILAMDRYERITSHTLWKGKRHILFLLLRILILLGYVLSMILYGLCYVTSSYLEYGDYMQRIHPWAEYRNLVFVPLFLTTLFIYYTLTIRMVYFCILVNKEHRKILFKKFRSILWQWIKQAFKKPSTVSQSTPSGASDAISPTRLVLAVKMMTYFILLFLTDCIILGVIAWMTLISSELHLYDDLFSIGQFWISLHVLCSFRLLDLVVEDLIAPWSLPGFTFSQVQE